ncbi:RloB family protein [Halosquirtibacter xylanolyticus]|uniref:RloB family protein n=1 Tax=Halosquirtibacter xylanolyticus TaxID=3374599 RepID=UPI00374A0F41|nr:RloB family protein [Prolixibacteraceae bacterium]
MSRKRKGRGLNLKYAVLGEGITEQWYLKHLKDLKGYKYSIRPSLFADIGIEKAEDIIDELISGGCDQIFFLTDYDTIINQNKKAQFKKLVDKYKDEEGVFICDSMPSIEYWFLLHFTYTTKEYLNYEQIEQDLKKHIPDYKKKIKYLTEDRWFKQLMSNGDLDKACSHAQKGLKKYQKGNVGEHFPFTKIADIIREFEKQKNNQ